MSVDAGAQAEDQRPARTELLFMGLHLFALSALAVAQPIFDLLARSPEFFVARDSDPLDVVLMTVSLCVVPPAVLTLLGWGVGVFGRTARMALHCFLVGGLVAAMAMPAIKRLNVTSDVVLVAIALGLGVAAAVAYARLATVRSVLSLMSLLALFFPVRFLVLSPVARVVFEPASTETELIQVRSDVPVVVVIFDELLLTSLMTGEHEIDAGRFPNLAAFAATSTWYRNATTVAIQTMTAVPAILTGEYPKGRRLPRASDYPRTLFTLLGSSHEPKVLESLTQLCPEELCVGPAKEGLWEQMESLTRDLAYVYAQMLAPRGLASRLPDVTTTWRNFQSQEGVQAPNPASQFDEFLASIEESESPRLYFLHSLLPHLPWQYLPSGKRYGPVSSPTFPHGLGRETWETWSEDDWHVKQAFQRYLLQLRFVDTLIGRLRAHLEELGVYDRTLIVLTADHGVSFRAGDKRRPITKTNYQDILPVLLLIKAPGQTEGRIDDRVAETIDILPTIADHLGFEMPWPVDGASLLGPSVRTIGDKVVFRAEGEHRLTFPDPHEAKYLTLAWLRNEFGVSSGPEGLFRMGRYSELVARRLEEFEIEGEGPYQFELERPRITDDVDLDALVLPVHVSGRIVPDTGSEFDIAVAINGVIEAVTRTYRDGTLTKFTAMLPELALRHGDNRAEFFTIHQPGASRAPRLRMLRERRASVYELGAGRDRVEVLLSSDGRTIPINPQAGLRGYLDNARYLNGRVELAGWAADVGKQELGQAIVVIANGEFLFAGSTSQERTGGAETIRLRGFVFSITDDFLKHRSPPELRLFVVSKRGEATELIYPEGYAWGGSP